MRPLKIQSKEITLLYYWPMCNTVHTYIDLYIFLNLFIPIIKTEYFHAEDKYAIDIIT